MTTVIATRGLTKRFGRVRAVDGIDLDVRAGDVYGFLGANGSGKTTTVRMLLGLVLATSGEVDVLGERMPRAGRQVLPRVGALIEGPAAYGHLSGRENLALLDASGPGGGRAHPAAPDRRGARAGRPVRCRQPAGAGLLAGHAAAAGAGRCVAPPPGVADPRRADERPGPAGHRRGPRAAARAEPQRDNGFPVQPPAGRGRADGHPGRRARPRPPGAAGTTRRAHRADWQHGRHLPGAGPGAGDDGRPGQLHRRASRRRPRRRPGRDQRPARRCRGAGDRAGARATDARGGRAGRGRRQHRPGRCAIEAPVHGRDMRVGR